MDQLEHPDWALVVALGGASKVAEMLRDEKDCSIQRVQNWKTRGIPASVKLAHPGMFLPNMTVKRAPRPAKQQVAKAA